MRVSKTLVIGQPYRQVYIAAMAFDFVYHASPQRGIKVFEPRVSTFREASVYATPHIEMACAYLAKWGDVDFAQWHSDGHFHFIERYPEAFDKIFSNAGGSLYKLPGATFEPFNGMEAISKVSVPVLEEEVIDNARLFIESVSNRHNLTLYFYPSRPVHLVPADDSDLIEKVARWIRKEQPKELNQSSIFQNFSRKHPHLAQRLTNELSG